ncbi:hypothetical protein Tco_0856766 [Tanacetum coccineum]|uniref:Reverse transcriptase domain-containing protein n=1 Tax=Tanacetum coccineum TaxID=301880 RepID=A0ABQ5B639_9ASTR
MPREGLAIIESKSKVRYSRSRPNDSRAITNAPSSTSSPSNNSFEIQQMAALLEDKMNIRMSRLEKAISEKNATTLATVKAVEEVCVTCGVLKRIVESYAKANVANMNNLQIKLDNFQRNQNDFQRVYNDSQKNNTIPNPRNEAKQIPHEKEAHMTDTLIPPPPVVEKGTEVTKDTEHLAPETSNLKLSKTSGKDKETQAKSLL